MRPRYTYHIRSFVNNAKPNLNINIVFNAISSWRVRGMHLFIKLIAKYKTDQNCGIMIFQGKPLSVHFERLNDQYSLPFPR